MDRVLLVQPAAGMRGPHRTIVAFAEWLAPRWEVTLAAPGGWVLKEAARRAPGVRIVELPGRWAAVRRGSSRLLASLVERDRPALIHANGIGALGLVASMARRTRTPVLVHAHGSSMSPRERAGLRVWGGLGANIRVYGVSETANDVVGGSALSSRISGILPNPIEREVFAVPPPPFGRPVTVGALLSTAPHKGLMRFVHVAAAAGRDLRWRAFGLRPHENPRLLAAARARAERLGVADRIEWCDAVSAPAHALAGLDVLLVPSDRESFCRVAVEGMAARRPVVATRVGGLTELVSDGANGLLFDPRRPEEGAAAVRRVVEDSELRRAIVDRAARTAARHGLEVVGPRLDRVYAEVLERRPAAEVPA